MGQLQLLVQFEKHHKRVKIFRIILKLLIIIESKTANITPNIKPIIVSVIVVSEWESNKSLDFMNSFKIAEGAGRIYSFISLALTIVSHKTTKRIKAIDGYIGLPVFGNLFIHSHAFLFIINFNYRYNSFCPFLCANFCAF